MKNSKKKKTNIKENIDQNKYTFDLINQWIQHAENKASLLLAFVIALSGIIQFVCSKLIIPTYETTPKVFIIFIIVLTLGTVSFIIAIIFFLIVIFPSLTSFNSSENKYSIFFEDIASFQSFDSYHKVVIETNDEQFNEEIIKEIYINSKICSKKMKNIKRAIIYSIITSLFMIFELLLCWLS